MHRTPEEASDETINRLWEPDGPVLPRYVIDLRKKYAFQITRHGLDRAPEYQCVDMLTFDPDPDSTWHLIGYGPTSGDAQLDLLEKIAYAVAHE